MPALTNTQTKVLLHNGICWAHTHTLHTHTRAQIDTCINAAHTHTHNAVSYTHLTLPTTVPV